MKLSQFHDVFGLKSERENGLLMDIRILRNHLPNLFPAENSISSLAISCNQEDRVNDVYSVEYLPYHTRDNKWLIRYVTDEVGNYVLEGYMPMASIKHFVKESPIFDKARCAYEQRLVKKEILRRLLQPATPLSADLPDYDRYFRHSVSKKMHRLGIGQHSIEVALETNADLWREATMVQAFAQRFPYPQDAEIKQHLTDYNGLWWKELEDLKQQHQDHWLKYREYEYYQQHRDIIDSLDLATDKMLLLPQEAQKLHDNVVMLNKLADDLLKKMFMNQAQSIDIAEMSRV